MLFYGERPRIHPNARPITLDKKDFVKISTERRKMMAIEFYECDKGHERIERRVNS